MKDGQGRKIWANGDVYTGGWKDDYLHSKTGIYKHYEGTHYQGGFQQGMKHGQGYLHSPNGMKYRGKFANNKIEGRSTFKWPDGRAYYGMFKNNKMEG